MVATSRVHREPVLGDHHIIASIIERQHGLHARDRRQIMQAVFSDIDRAGRDRVPCKRNVKGRHRLQRRFLHSQIIVHGLDLVHGELFAPDRVQEIKLRDLDRRQEDGIGHAVRLLDGVHDPIHGHFPLIKVPLVEVPHVPDTAANDQQTRPVVWIGRVQHRDGPGRVNVRVPPELVCHAVFFGNVLAIHVQSALDMDRLDEFGHRVELLAHNRVAHVEDARMVQARRDLLRRIGVRHATRRLPFRVVGFEPPAVVEHAMASATVLRFYMAPYQIKKAWREEQQHGAFTYQRYSDRQSIGQ